MLHNNGWNGHTEMKSLRTGSNTKHNIESIDIQINIQTGETGLVTNKDTVVGIFPVQKL